MKTASLIVFLTVSIIAATLVFAGNGNDSATPEHWETLKELKERINALEKRLDALEKQREVLQGHPNIVIPDHLPPPDALPKGWKRKEFNGLPYYIIPIEKNQNK